MAKPSCAAENPLRRSGSDSDRVAADLQHKSIRRDLSQLLFRHERAFQGGLAEINGVLRGILPLRQKAQRGARRLFPDAPEPCRGGCGMTVRLEIADLIRGQRERGRAAEHKQKSQQAFHRDFSCAARSIFPAETLSADF